MNIPLHVVLSVIGDVCERGCELCRQNQGNADRVASASRTIGAKDLLTALPVQRNICSGVARMRPLTRDNFIGPKCEADLL